MRMGFKRVDDMLATILTIQTGVRRYQSMKAFPAPRLLQILTEDLSNGLLNSMTVLMLI